MQDASTHRFYSPRFCRPRFYLNPIVLQAHCPCVRPLVQQSHYSVTGAAARPHCPQPPPPARDPAARRNSRPVRIKSCSITKLVWGMRLQELQDPFGSLRTIGLPICDELSVRCQRGNITRDRFGVIKILSHEHQERVITERHLGSGRAKHKVGVV